MSVDVRDEDAFDVDALHAWLQEHAPDVAPAGSTPPHVRQFAGGASNLTFLLDYADRSFVLRQPPRGHKAASAHDMGREVLVQQRLRPSYPLVPQVFAYCEDPAVIGEPFYVMSRIPGIILRKDLPDGVHLRPEQAAQLAHTVIDAQAALHLIDPASAGLADLDKGPGYVERQVLGWSKRYRSARTDDVSDAEAVMAWLDQHRPDDVAHCIIHGDWRLDNLVLDLSDPPTIVGVLDWEMATVGDPLMDVGASLAYWVCADDEPQFHAMRLQPTDLPGMPTREQYVERYVAQTGFDVVDFRFYEVFGLFRLAVIAQQIWYRYRRHETSNPAFAGFGAAVNMLVDRAQRRVHQD